MTLFWFRYTARSTSNHRFSVSKRNTVITPMTSFIACDVIYGRPYYGTSISSVEPDQAPQNVASDQVLHCLLT